MAEVSIYSDEARAVINQEIAKFIALRPGLSSLLRRRRPVGGVSASRFMLGIVTAVFGTDQPSYSVKGLEFPLTTVTQGFPIWRGINASTAVIPAKVNDLCLMVRDTEDIWRLGLTIDFLATDDCQAVAGSRSNMAVSFVTTTPVSALPITADLVVVHDTVSNVTLTLPESEVGKPIKVANASTTGHDVIITNIIFGVANTRIAPSEVFDMGYTGNNSIGWIL